MPEITVGHIKHEFVDERWKVYVGRPSSLGNPFEIGRHGDRQEVITQYATWLDEQMADPTSPAARKFAGLLRLVKRHGRLHLLCWCAPEACHADVIRERLLAALGEAGTGADDAAPAGEASDGA